MSRTYIRRRYFDFAEEEMPRKKKKGILRRAAGLGLKGAAAYGIARAGKKIADRAGKRQDTLGKVARGYSAGYGKAKSGAKLAGKKAGQAAKGTYRFGKKIVKGEK